jgi:hypothetical protein
MTENGSMKALREIKRARPRPISARGYTEPDTHIPHGHTTEADKQFQQNTIYPTRKPDKSRETDILEE